MLRDQIKWINHVAQENFDEAKGMLEMLNSILGTRYGFLNKRVIRFVDPDRGYASGCHDLYTELGD